MNLHRLGLEHAATMTTTTSTTTNSTTTNANTMQTYVAIIGVVKLAEDHR